MKTKIATYSKPVVGLVLLLTCSLALQAAVPEGWILAGSKPASYDVGTDAQAFYNGHPSAYLKAKVPVTDGFGTLMQAFRAEKYLGKRVRFSAFVKSEGVVDWAGLWMRVDKDSAPVAFDNMQSGRSKELPTGRSMKWCWTCRKTQLASSMAFCWAERAKSG